MNKIILLYKNSILEYYLTNNSFVPCKVEHGPEFFIKNITSNGYYEIESENNNIFIFYNEYDNYYWVVDRTFQTVSTVKNGFISGDWYETNICLLDANKKSLCYRFPRNASTTIFSTYLKSFNFDFNFRTKDNIYVSKDLECIENSINVKDLNKLDYKNIIKYFVYRDPIDRFFSQASFYMHSGWIRRLKMFPKIPTFIFKDPTSTINFLMKCFEINKYYDFIDEYHLNSQTKHLKNLQISDDLIDLVVDINNTHDFLQKHLGLTLVNKNVSIPKFSINKYNIEITKLLKLKDIFSEDYELIEKFKDKLYK